MKMKKYVFLLLPLILASCSVQATSSESSTSSSVEESVTESTSESSPEESSTSLADGKKEYVFEAEWSEGIEDMIGYGYSGTVTGLNLIQPDPGGKGASNGYYVSYLYSEGQTLTWTITASTALTKVKMTARFACEYMNISFTSTEYLIEVNGTPIGYQTISMTGVDSSAADKMIPFSDYVLNENVSLQEGENTIQFITNNSNPMMGTMYATAPLVDCFKLETEGELSWNPVTSNTD